MSHVREIPNSGLLVSLYQYHTHTALLGIYDISQKGKARKVYSYDDTRGSIIYNIKRPVLLTFSFDLHPYS